MKEARHGQSYGGITFPSKVISEISLVFKLFLYHFCFLLDVIFFFTLRANVNLCSIFFIQVREPLDSCVYSLSFSLVHVTSEMLVYILACLQKV